MTESDRTESKADLSADADLGHSHANAAAEDDSLAPSDRDSNDLGDPEEASEFEDEAEAEEPEPKPDPRRAAFLRDLPDTEQLRPLVAAFASGNYALLRQLERGLASQTQDPEILAAAHELVGRTEPDPLSKKLLGLSVLFFLFIVGWVYLHHAH